MSVQYIMQNGNAAFAVMPIAEYRAMLAALEDIDDERAYDQAMERAKSCRHAAYPAEIAEALVAGENPLRVIREWRGKSVSDLAAELDVTTAHIYQIESGRREMSVPLLRRLAEILDVDADLLI